MQIVVCAYSNIKAIFANNESADSNIVISLKKLCINLGIKIQW